jgi:hypothetical protein
MPARQDTARQRLHRKKPEYGQTKAARLAYERVIGNVVDLEYDGLTPYWVRDHIPEAWDRLEKDIDVFEKKVQITIRLDESVAKYFRAMGPGYQARINRVLATFAQMRIAQINAIEQRRRVKRAEEG